jgi:hypothetical protein
MGAHRAATTRRCSALVGRGALTAAAALALTTGGVGVAFAGDAPDHGHSQDHDGHGEKGHHGHHGKHHGKHDKCEIPLVDPTVETTEGAVNDATGDATRPVFEAGTQATAPVHDAVCPPARDILGPVVGEDGPGAPELPVGTPEELPVS